VRRHSSVNERAASMAVRRYGERMSISGQTNASKMKEGDGYKEEV